MDKKRRDFLKVAGISTLAGLGGTTVVGRLVDAGPTVANAAGGHAAPAEESHGAPVQKTGKRYGMVVDVRKFREDPSLGETVERACIKAHNIPEFPDKKDAIKWIWMTNYENSFPEKGHLYKDTNTTEHQVPVFCNHCDSPPCVRACPTKATFKREKDGLVIMDYHRCIGCRFCMAACPYGMRSFNWRNPRPFIKEMNKDFPTRMRGVVKKCNFCAERIGVGKLPACVEACGDSQALVFGDLNDPHSEVRKLLKENFTIQRRPALGTHPSVFYIV